MPKYGETVVLHQSTHKICDKMTLFCSATMSLCQRNTQVKCKTSCFKQSESHLDVCLTGCPGVTFVRIHVCFLSTTCCQFSSYRLLPFCPIGSTWPCLPRVFRTSFILCLFWIVLQCVWSPSSSVSPMWILYILIPENTDTTTILVKINLKKYILDKFLIQFPSACK